MKYFIIDWVLDCRPDWGGQYPHQGIAITGSDVPIGCGLIIPRVRVNEIEFGEPWRSEPGQGLYVWLNHI